MAVSRPRPRVVVSQVINKTAAPALLPSLMPALVGPCYQIVRPLLADGTINSDAAVVTAARITSGILGESLSLSAKYMKITVGGGVPQVFQFPATRNSVPISRTLAVNTINKNLSGATAAIVDDALVLWTTATGSAARIKIQTVDDSAYAALALTDSVDIEFTGNSVYTGLACNINFGDMPADKTAVSNVVFDTDDLDVFVSRGGKLFGLRQNAAPSWDAYVGGSSASGNVAIDRACQPALGNTTIPVFGLRSPAQSTNSIFAVGKHASVRIPLAGYSVVNGQANWPDATGGNYLEATAAGLQDYLASGGAVNDYVGSTGNDLTVILEELPEDDGVAVAMVGDEVTISLAPNCTFVELKVALANAGLSSKILFNLKYAAAHAALPPVYTGCDVFGTYYLSGGLDPVSFNPDSPAVAKATITGAVHLPDSPTGAALDVAGETVSFSIDGAAWKSATLLSGTSVVTTIASALDGVATVSRLAADDVKNGLGQTFRPLRISTVSENGSDSSIRVAGSEKVIANLFGGFNTRTASNVSFSIAGGYGTTKRAGTIAQSVYNPLAYVSGEKAIVPGSVTVVLKSVVLPGFILAANNDLTSILDNTCVINITYNDVTADLEIDVPADATISDIAELLATEVTGIVELTGLGVTSVSIGASDYLCFFDGSGTAGRELVINDEGNELDTLFDNLLGLTATTSSGNVTISDTGDSFSLLVTAFSNNLSNSVFDDTVLDVSDSASLTSLTLDSNTARSYIAYATTATLSSGAIRLSFTGDSVESEQVDKAAVFVKLLGGQTADVTFTRMSFSAARQESVSYDGRVFTGDFFRLLPGDMVYRGATVLGRVVDVLPLTLGGTTYSGAKIVLSEASVSSGATITDWHIDAYGLDAADNARIAPEVVVTAASETIAVKPLLLRSNAGMPITGSAQMFASYRALRRDIAPIKPTSVMLTLTDQDLDRLLGPVTPENPLAWAFYTASLVAPNTTMAAIAVDAVSSDAPYGTPEAYSRALSYLLNKEVYALALCTNMPSVCDMQSSHVTLASSADYGKERIALATRPIPTEKNPLVAASGTATIQDVGGGKYELTFTDETLNIADALDGLKDANGDSISASVGQDFDPAQGVYLDRAGDAYKWLITKIVATNIVQIDTSDIYMPGGGPGTGGNDDGYFRTDTSPLAEFEADGEACSVCVRQAAINTDTASGREAICQGLSDIATAYANRRLFIVMPDYITMDYAGTPTKVPSFHAAAQIAAMVAVLPTQQSFSNYPMVGITGLSGSLDTFSDRELGIAAAGGIYWLIQDGDGEPVKARHQLSTDTSSVATQELSITKPTDLFAKTIRAALKPKPGRNNIDTQFLTELTMDLQAICAQFAGAGLPLAAANVESIKINPNRVDGIVAEVSKQNWIPCNEIYITISN